MDSLPRTVAEYRILYEANIPEGVEWGECWCGCGARTKVPTRTSLRDQAFRGIPNRFIHNHHRRKHVGKEEYVVDPDTGCWNWQFSKHPQGYGKRYVYGSLASEFAHVAYYREKYGDIPAGMDLDHLCRNESCVNPDHLELVTHAENCRRGRATKLTWAEVNEMRDLYETKGWRGADLARRYHVTPTQVSNILKYRQWAVQ